MTPQHFCYEPPGDDIVIIANMPIYRQHAILSSPDIALATGFTLKRYSQFNAAAARSIMTALIEPLLS